MNRRAARRSALVAAPLLSLLFATACSSGDSTTKAADVSYPSQSYSAPDSNTALGTADEPIPSQIPEGLHVGEINPIGANEMLAVQGGFGNLEVPVEVIDPATGKSTAHIVVGSGIWDSVIHGFVGTKSSDPAVLAAEVWRPRGSRGAADFTVSEYSGNLLNPKEVKLPSVARVHSRNGSHAVSSDGKYFVTWDDGLFGVRVVDLAKGKESGSLKLPNCGPFVWMIGHDVYSVCEQSHELLHLKISDDGVPSEVERKRLLSDDFVSARETSFAVDAKKSLLVSPSGETYVFDLASGLPTSQVKPIGNVGDPSGRFDKSAINADGSRIIVTYTDSKIAPGSVRGGDTAKVVLFDSSGLKQIRTLALADIGVDSIKSAAFSMDGKTLYVLGDGKAGDSGQAPQKLVGFAAADGHQVSSVTLADGLGGQAGLGDLIAPERIG